MKFGIDRGVNDKMAFQVKKQSSDRQRDTNKEIKTWSILNHCFAITAAATKDAGATAKKTTVHASRFPACVEKAVTQPVSHLKREFSLT